MLARAVQKKGMLLHKRSSAQKNILPFVLKPNTPISHPISFKKKVGLDRSQQPAVVTEEEKNLGF